MELSFRVKRNIFLRYVLLARVTRFPRGGPAVGRESGSKHERSGPPSHQNDHGGGYITQTHCCDWDVISLWI